MGDVTSRCERCGDPFGPTQETQKYCSSRCRESAKKRRSRLRPLAGKLRGTTGDTGDESLTDAYERSAELARPDASYVVDDERNIYAGDAGHDDGVNHSWSASLGLQRQLDSLLAEYDDKGRPYLATQRRNPGPRLPQLVRLDREYAGKAQALIDNYARTSAMERASRTRHRRAEDAHDRTAGQRAAAEFADALRKRGIDLPNAGRATSDIMGVRESADPFAQDDRSMWKSSGIARNMMSSGFGSFPGDARSWR